MAGDRARGRPLPAVDAVNAGAWERDRIVGEGGSARGLVRKEGRPVQAVGAMVDRIGPRLEGA